MLILGSDTIIIIENESFSRLHKFNLKTTVNGKMSNFDKPLSGLWFLSETSLSCYEANALFCVK